MNVHIFVLSHKQEVLNRVPSVGYLQKVLLSDLELPNGLQDNRIGEHRAFLADLEPPDSAEYVGYLNGRSEAKYRNKDFYWSNLPRKFKSLQPDVVLVCWPAQADWAAFSDKQHHGMYSLLEELGLVSGLPIEPMQESLWANDFICHRLVWKDWRVKWRKWFAYFHGKYGFDLPFPTVNVDPPRKAAYFYERFSTLYFANRTDLTVQQL